MNNAFQRIALRLPVAVKTAPIRSQVARNFQHNLPERPFLNGCCRRRAQAAAFTTSRPVSNGQGRKPAPAPAEAEDRRAALDTAQKKVDDRPWMRADSQFQPQDDSADAAIGDDSKGRLLTTPTRLLKLILPMPFHPDQQYIDPTKEQGETWSSQQVEPLALLVHPHQPLSYLERLIQAEIPPLKVKDREKLPHVSFRAEADKDDTGPAEDMEDNIASYSGLGHEGPDRSGTDWVRWSSSTEVGDFIRDAARGREFAIVIEGLDREIRVAVPSFRDRTHYMRLRLRRMSRELNDMAKIKKECDELAHRGAHRIAQGGFGALVGWWGIVYYVTFHTEMGWDLVEPVTYLAGLTTIMGGYLWFLYMSRDLSYKAAMNITVSRRQSALYQERGFNQAKWEQLVHDANALRKEIKFVAQEYDVDWNELKDLGGDKDVKEALEEEEEGTVDGKKKKEEKKREEAKNDEGSKKQDN